MEEESESENENERDDVLEEDSSVGVASEDVDLEGSSAGTEDCMLQ